MMKLTPSQYKFLSIYFGHSIVMTERDGTYMPYMYQKRTVTCLVNRGLLEYQETGVNGYVYNGYTITAAGREVYAEYLRTKNDRRR